MIYHIGLDISKCDFHACFDESESIDKFSTADAGIDSFLDALKKRNMTRGKTLIGMEATGSYHLPVAYRCTRAGYTVNIIKPSYYKKTEPDRPQARQNRQCRRETGERLREGRRRLSVS